MYATSCAANALLLLLRLLCAQFLKRWSSIDQMPPDPNRGIEVPTAVVTCGGRQLVSSKQLMHVPQPDGSMPFNVITLTCTLMAFFIGTFINVLVRKSDWKEKKDEQQSDKPDK